MVVELLFGLAMIFIVIFFVALLFEGVRASLIRMFHWLRSKLS